MKAIKLSRLLRHDESKPTLRQRAASLKASAARVLRMSNPSLPAPGSEKAKALFHAASSEFDRRAFGGTQRLTDVLMRQDGSGCWTKRGLGLALEEGSITVAEYVRLHPLAAEREAVMDETARSLNLAVLHALAYGSDGHPDGGNEADTGSPSATEVTPSREAAGPHRRSLVLGSLAGAATLPALAIPAFAFSLLGAPAEPHLDQDLFDAEAEVSRARAALDAAEKASGEAYSAFWEGVGPCPAVLLVKPWERMTFGRVAQPWLQHKPRWAWVAKYEGDDGKPDPMAQAWTVEGLRATIGDAVLLFGRGGQTPHLIREWRSLLPVAEAFERRRTEMDARFRCKELSAARKAASGAHHAARVTFSDMPAKTLDGLALKTRQLDGAAWQAMPSNWVSLLQSAALVSGVTLREPNYDPAGWVRDWEAAGGTIKRHPATQEVMFCAPRGPCPSPEARTEVSRLQNELGANETLINRWVRAQG